MENTEIKEILELGISLVKLILFIVVAVFMPDFFSRLKKLGWLEFYESKDIKKLNKLDKIMLTYLIHKETVIRYTELRNYIRQIEPKIEEFEIISSLHKIDRRDLDYIWFNCGGHNKDNWTVNIKPEGKIWADSNSKIVKKYKPAE